MRASRPTGTVQIAFRLALALLVAGATPIVGDPVDGEVWRWPVSGDRRVVRPFIAPTHQWSPGHRGIDVQATDRIVVAPADGVVRFAGWVVDRPVLSIDHGGVVSSYEPVVASVASGETVAAGQVIGSLELGHCVSRCLHFGVRVGGAYRNPLLWLDEVPRSVLLPTRSIG